MGNESPKPVEEKNIENENHQTQTDCFCPPEAENIEIVRASFLRTLFPEGGAKHVILFILTFMTTYFIGGFWYSICLMSILTAHEMGHYLTSVKYNVQATPPFFIPFPLPPFGTIGAVIKMKSPMQNRKVLFDIGLLGPLFGLAISIPVIVVGLKLSQIVDVSRLHNPNFLTLGEPLFFKAIQYLVLGPIPEGKDVLLHPVAFAGWVGLFVTALNLLPIGQLDGGHVVYAVFGKERAEKIYIFVMVGMGIVILFLNPGWFLLMALILFFGFKHPPPLDDQTPLDDTRKIIGIITLVFFFLSFTPIPFPDEILRLRQSLF